MSVTTQNNQYPEEISLLTQQLRERLEESGLSPDEIELILLTFGSAAEIHEQEIRRNGKHFIHHPFEVALGLLALRMDAETICAGLLHDAGERYISEGMSREEAINYLRDLYGRRVQGGYDIGMIISMVSALTRDSGEVYFDSIARISNLPPEEKQRAFIVKSVDRSHNVTDMESFSPQERLRSVYKSILLLEAMEKSRSQDLQFSHQFDRAFMELATHTYEAIQNIIDKIRGQSIQDGCIDYDIREIIPQIREKYDQMIRTHKLPRQSYQEMYTDALSLGALVTQLFTEYNRKYILPNLPEFPILPIFYNG